MDKINILFPGSFKPFTGAHIYQITEYLKDKRINNIIVIIGTGERCGINQDMSYSIALKLFNNHRIKIIKSKPFILQDGKKIYSPIISSGQYIEHDAEPGIYSMIASTKNNDYDRVKEFYDYFTIKAPQKLSIGIKVFMPPKTIEPLLYVGRSDNYNNTPISASILRKDILNNDRKNFETNYPYSSEEIKYFIWDYLEKIIRWKK